MTASLPVIEYAKEWNTSEEELYRALVVSNLTTIHQKSGIGRLSAFAVQSVPAAELALELPGLTAVGLKAWPTPLSMHWQWYQEFV